MRSLHERTGSTAPRHPAVVAASASLALALVPGQAERLAPPREPVYDFERLRRQVEELEGYDRAWNPWFEAQGVTPLRVGYESLAADPAGYLFWDDVHITTAGHQIVAGAFAAALAPVPEAQTWAMLLAGLALLGLARRARG